MRNTTTNIGKTTAGIANLDRRGRNKLDRIVVPTLLLAQSEYRHNPVQRQKTFPSRSLEAKKERSISNRSGCYTRANSEENAEQMVKSSLKDMVERSFAAGPAAVGDVVAMDAFMALRESLEKGLVRAAEPDPEAPFGWRVNGWVKQGILLGFRLGVLVDVGGEPLAFVDKHTFPARRFATEDGVRIVPGGSAIRAGAFVAPGVVCMPPMYINAGAYVGEGTMVDSHALVGSCAQIGKRVHLSAAAQIGGVLEPVNAAPVVIEDDVLVGGNCGVYEGTLVRRRAVLGAGTILTRGTPVYDLVKGDILRAEAGRPLIIPEAAVVVPGSRAVTHGKGLEWNVSLYTPVIVKYRDEKTELSMALEDLLR
jgi:2,3,4,5-tetrahydropyridine-2-carboxylate N-succinyltransferase